MKQSNIDSLLGKLIEQRMTKIKSKSEKSLQSLSNATPSNQQQKLQGLVSKFKRRIYPEKEIKKKKFENHFTVFQDMNTFLPVEDYIKNLSDDQISKIKQQWRKVKVQQVFQHYHEQMDLMLAKKDDSENDDRLMMDVNLLKTAYDRLSKHPRPQQSQRLSNLLIKTFETQSIKKQQDSTEFASDDFYDKVGEYLTQQQAPSLEINESQVKDVRQLLSQLGMDESEQTSHLAKIIDSPMKQKRLEPIVKLNFNEKAESFLKILKKASQNIYRKNIVESIEEEKRAKQEMKEIRERILKKKRRRIQVIEDRLDTLDIDEFDLSKMKFRMSPQVRGSIVRLSPLECSPKPSPRQVGDRNQNQRTKNGETTQKQRHHIQRRGLIGQNPLDLLQLQPIKSEGKIQPPPQKIRLQKDVEQRIEVQNNLPHYPPMKIDAFNMMRLKQMVFEYQKYDQYSRNKYPADTIQKQLEELQQKKTQPMKVEIQKKYPKKLRNMTNPDISYSHGTKTYMLIIQGYVVPSPVHILRQKKRLISLMDDIEQVYGENKLQKVTYEEMIDRMENNKDRVITNILKGDQLASLKYLIKSTSVDTLPKALRRKSQLATRFV